MFDAVVASAAARPSNFWSANTRSVMLSGLHRDRAEDLG
jgi:hypothetical protein